ncbi:hypothetical protein [Nocardioides sp. KR10-350]|uniref:hypothetical protein n=1 Tax=Nocardioides cheoyonin TaxID=3156615 RepID=UPI0032B5911D
MLPEGTGGGTTAVPDDLITQLTKLLGEDAGNISKTLGDLKKVPGSHFGGSATGASLAHHTDLAHEFVVNALRDVVTGLNNYEAGFAAYRKGMHDVQSGFVDATQKASVDLEAGANCMTPPQVGAPTTCTAVPSDKDGA